MVTQKDLAFRLGVSQNTVSKALRGVGGISDRVRDRVLDVARQLGYSIEHSGYDARVLRARAGGGSPARTHLLCAIVGEAEDARGFGGHVFHGMNQACRDNEYEVLLQTQADETLPRIVSRRHVDGVMWLISDADIARNVPGPPVPWIGVLFDRPGVDCVIVDNISGMRAVADHLCGLGHTRIAWIGMANSLGRERLEGLRAGAAGHGVNLEEHLIRTHKYGQTDYLIRQMIDELLAAGKRDHPSFTALTCYNDFTAVLAIQHLTARGLKVPDDISVTGFDGVLPYRMPPPARITTAAIPLEAMGVEAVRLLLNRIRDPKSPRRKVVLETRLVDGDTSGPVPGRVAAGSGSLRGGSGSMHRVL